ncbi:ketopantoate reductase family protein [Sphingobium estronivorans]|uniref:ketopantoate reductase family protein n=1 Tax=Sphingobium estronivorans TaxID=1577690 RepID=UPI0013C365ED|nr:2-dehydropantoate 2-reductase [Sphingobium estronivorans]
MGAGALGSVFASRLAAAGHDVLLVGRSGAHVEAIRSGGLLLTDAHGRREAAGAFEARTDLTCCASADVIIILTKSQDCVAAMLQSAVLAGPQSISVVLANGIGHMEAIEAACGARLLAAGATTVGARVVQPGHVEITGGTAERATGASFGPWAQSCALVELQPIAEALTLAGCPSEALADIRPLIWTKFAMACAMNAAGAITGLPVRDLIASRSACELLIDVIDEIVLIGRAKGIALDPVAVQRTAFETYRNAPGHLPSMAVDMRAGRPTEVDALNAAVVREAGLLGMAAPVNACLTQLVRAMEEARDAQSRSGTH